jgi:hypothetical protein
MHLRGRAGQLGEGFGDDVDTETAILDIAVKLMNEGLQTMDTTEEIINLIKQKIIFTLPWSQNNQHCIILYHILLWKTGGKSKWTVTRHCGESKVIPYLPSVLEALNGEMSAETCIQGEFIHESNYESAIDQSDPYFLKIKKFDWEEISLLEFLNGTVPKEKVQIVKGQHSQPTVPIVTSLCKKINFRKSTDQDIEVGEEIFINQENSPYVRTGVDFRKLYDIRPDIMENMVLGQFATQYYLMNKSQKHSYYATKATINQNTKIGPNSTDIIVGVPSAAAPLCMQLKNGGIMKKRRGRSFVPHLLYTGELDRHGNCLMWENWRCYEKVEGHEQTDEETTKQIEVRLSIFPMSVYPMVTSSDEVSE